MCFVQCGKKKKSKLTAKEREEVKMRALGKLFEHVVKKNHRYFKEAREG